MTQIPSFSETQTIQYLHFTQEIPCDLPQGSFVSIDRDPPLKIHKLGFQPAKSIPEIPRWFLHRYGSQHFTVLEPFAGSGTSIVESVLYGAAVYWLDYNPLSRLICQVKTTCFQPEAIWEAAQIMLQQVEQAQSVTVTLQFSNIDFWFQPAVQEGLILLSQAIRAADPALQPVLWLVLAATVRKTSDMNDGMILAAKRSHIQAIPQRSRQEVFRTFQQYLEQTIDALVEWNHRVQDWSLAQPVASHDARCLEGDWVCDAVITSPPYINAIDYVWACKFELHWLGLVQDNQERLNLYEKEIGTERIPRKQAKELGQTGHPLLDQLLQDIYTGRYYQASQGQNHLRSRVVYQYFLDMKTHFHSSFARLKPGGYYCFAIGDISRICGVNIPVASLLTDLAVEVGFRPDFHFHLLLKNRRLNLPRNVDWASTIKHDTIVVLQKPEAI